MCKRCEAYREQIKRLYEGIAECCPRRKEYWRQYYKDNRDKKLAASRERAARRRQERMGAE